MPVMPGSVLRVRHGCTGGGVTVLLVGCVVHVRPVAWILPPSIREPSSESLGGSVGPETPVYTGRAGSRDPDSLESSDRRYR